MKILFIHTIGKNKYGGGERWVVNAAAALKNRGHEVFVGSKKNSKILKEASEKGVNTVNFNILSDLSIYMAIKISRFLKKHKIDVVISKRRDLAVSGMAAKLGTHPVVLVRSGSPPQRSIKKHLFIIEKFSDGIITNTKTIKDFYYLKGLNKKIDINVIYNGLNINDSVKAKNFKEDFGEKKIILSVGRLSAEKGYNYLLEAASILKEKRNDLIFYIVGDGKLKEKLLYHVDKNKLNDIVYFAGYKEPITPHLKGCDIFVLPSLYEGMPNSAMEAMAYGKPVIMTKVNGAEELSDNGKHAFLIPPKDHNAIANAILSVLNDKEKSEKVAEDAKSFVRSKFTMSCMTDNLENLIINKYNAKKKNK